MVELPSRTVRYYIQLGLVDRPDGQNRGARYTTRHVEQLLTIKKWQTAGLSLDRIRELLHDDETALPPPRPKAPGTIEVWSRLLVAPGIELHIEAGESDLSPEQLRILFRKVMSLYQETKQATPPSIEKGNGNE
ncbi:MerR family transcriptional regulator [Propionivibrio sp.]|uniref:MerR family transcriptional regulator n=1 Tax=Propionivibrio sp. TaxID=2212460 RepID=UPI003BF0CC0D